MLTRAGLVSTSRAQRLVIVHPEVSGLEENDMHARIARRRRLLLGSHEGDDGSWTNASAIAVYVRRA